MAYWGLTNVIESASFETFTIESRWFFHSTLKHFNLSILVITSHYLNFWSFLAFNWALDKPNLIFYLMTYLKSSWEIYFLILFLLIYLLLLTNCLKIWHKIAKPIKLSFLSLPSRNLTLALTKILFKFF